MTETEAREIWDAMTDSEKAGVRFGLFPVRLQEHGKDLAVLLMKIAKEEK